MTLYVSDLDGTLLQSDATIGEETARRLNMLMEKGVAFTFATARSFSSAGEITKRLALKLPLITYNGAVVRDAKGHAEYAILDRAAISDLLNRLEAIGARPLVYALIDGQERCSWIQGAQSPGMERYISSRWANERMRPVGDYASLFEGEIYYFSLICAGDEALGAKALFARCNAVDAYMQNDTYFPEDYWVEAYRADVNKATAVERLKRQLNADKLICFGDNLNDMPMFQIADECYAVANACEPLKKIATAIIASNDDHGVARWMSENATFA